MVTDHPRPEVMRAYDCTCSPYCQPNQQIAFENTAKTFKNGSSIKKYVPAVLRKSYQLSKFAELRCFESINKKPNIPSPIMTRTKTVLSLICSKTAIAVKIIYNGCEYTIVIRVIKILIIYLTLP